MGQIFSRICEKFSGKKRSESVSIVDNAEKYSDYSKIVPGRDVSISIPDIHHSAAYPLGSDGNVILQTTSATRRKAYVEPLFDITNVHATRSLSEFVTARPPLQNYRRDRSPSTERDSRNSKKFKADDYLDFPILKDALTEQFISKSKVMVVMRGLSGSGKSFIVNKLLQLYGDKAVECSADLYFIQPDGRYEFDFHQLKDAHNSCYDAASYEMSTEQRPLVMINNTNVKFWEYKRYLALAKQHHYIVLIMQPQTPWTWDPAILATKTMHGMEDAALADKMLQFQPSQPIYCGWFLNPADSAVLVQQCSSWLNRITDVQHFCTTLAHYCRATAPHYYSSDSTELSYFRACGKGGQFAPLHCTAKFTNRGRAEGVDEYLNTSEVQQAMGKAYKLLVTCFVVTPRSLGVRVLLTEDLLPLWGQDDNLRDMPDNITELYDRVSDVSERLEPLMDTSEPVENGHEPLMDTSEPVENGHEHMQVDGTETFINTNLFDAETCSITESSSRTMDSLSYDQLQKRLSNKLVDRLHPVLAGCSKGRRAHMTLAVAPDVPAVVTGFDLLHLLQQEEEELLLSTTAGAGRRTVERVEGGVIVDYGGGVFVVYPHDYLVVNALFSAFY